MSVIFQKSLDGIHQFTLSIRLHVDLVCQHCQAVGQFIPHGWLHKMNNDGSIRRVGKRIICDRRRGGTGCGGTTKIIAETETHQLHVTAISLSVFILALASGLSVLSAYEKATLSQASRNAWRWWVKLLKREGDIRCFIFKMSEPMRTTAPLSHTQSPIPRRIQILRETLAHWVPLSDVPNNICADFQHSKQIALL